MHRTLNLIILIMVVSATTYPCTMVQCAWSIDTQSTLIQYFKECIVTSLILKILMMLKIACGSLFETF